MCKQRRALLASSVGIRMLDDTHNLDLSLTLPSTLVSLVGTHAQAGRRGILVQDLLESATAIRISPFKAGIYDVVEIAASSDPPTDRLRVPAEDTAAFEID